MENALGGEGIYKILFEFSSKVHSGLYGAGPIHRFPRFWIDYNPLDALAIYPG